MDIAGPVLVVAALLAIVISGRLQTYHGNFTGFVLFGQHWVQYTHPPRGALINSPYGYDGQFFYIQATDPLLLHDATINGFRGAAEAFRMQRLAYPMLAFLLAAGQRSAIPWSLLTINVLVVLGVTGGFAVYAHRRASVVGGGAAGRGGARARADDARCRLDRNRGGRGLVAHPPRAGSGAAHRAAGVARGGRASRRVRRLAGIRRRALRRQRCEHKPGLSAPVQRHHRRGSPRARRRVAARHRLGISRTSL